MTDERWQRVKALFQAAVERPTEERAAFLAAAAGDDGALRREVESLLTSDAAGGSFLNRLPVAGEALLAHPLSALPGSMGQTPSQTGLTTGHRLGAYEVVAPLGAGGMGEVYRARDTKLRRDVAIKVLPASVARDPDRLHRFEREAHMLASLNHPHIAAIYGFEESAGITALVLELVEGLTLAERIAAGPVPVEEALAIARQIAEALEAAHERGIIHRDLKPANVKLTPDGTVKVLDFGLAKVEAAAGNLTESPTIGAHATREGVIAGTAPYMSPEQARGKQVDKRADIWAFGCVLYELLTGARAFPGDTTTDVLAAVVNREPNFHALPPATPPSIRRLLARCLDKDPKRRLRDIGDARLEIDDALSSPHAPDEEHAGDRQARAQRRALLWAVQSRTGLAALVTVAIAIAFLAGRFTLGVSPAADVRIHRLTDWVGLEETPAISPDGRSVAFVASAGGSRQIWLRLVAGGAPLQLTRDSRDHFFPRWSRDSSSVLFFTSGTKDAASGSLWEVSALGGPPRRIADSIGAGDVSHAGAKLTFFRYVDGGIELVIAGRDGSGIRPVARLETGYYYLSPRWSPDDRLIAYHRNLTSVGDIFIVPAAGGTPRHVTQDGPFLEGLTWSADGSRIIFGSTRRATIRYLPTANLWSMTPDGGELRQLTFGEATYANPDAIRGGSVVASRWLAQSDIWRVPIDGSPLENAARATRVTRQTSQVFTPSIAPDESQVAYVSDTGGHANIWVHALATGESRQISYELEPDVQVGLPLWSPQGNRIAYFTARGNSLNYWLVNADGSNRRLLAPNAGYAAWSSDGQWLYFGAQPGTRILKKIPMSGGAEVEIRSDTATRPAPAPDGRTLYYVVEQPVWTGGADYEVRAASPETGPSRLLARIPDRRMPRLYNWQPVVSPDGQWLLLALVDDRTTNLWALSTTSGELRQLTDFRDRATIIMRRASWAPDGRSVFAAIGERDADIVVIEGLRP